MKQATVILTVLLFLPGFPAFADNERAGRSGPVRTQAAKGPSAFRSQAPASRPAVAPRPVVINIGRGSSGGHNRNFPSQQRTQNPADQQPSYGKIQWTPAARPSPVNARRSQVQALSAPPVVTGTEGSLGRNFSVKGLAGAGQRAAAVVHHHPYTQGYVRKKLQNIGVASEPSYITDRSEIIHTDRQHSAVRYPQKGPDRMPMTAKSISPRHFSDPMVRDHMALVGSPDWMEQARVLAQTENRPGHYFWHKENGFNYCHYIDGSGYHWYGWYVGDSCFWTRDYNGRWWWYDQDFDRTCFWNDGFWWWQDPYHLGDLYCYSNGEYIPANSAEDQVVVTVPDSVAQQVYASPDGTRTVKVVTDTQDAFLYDTDIIPGFEPVYLASGVQSVLFSDPGNGRPLEIILKLNDGSFDMFDGQGNAYNTGGQGMDQADGTNPPVAAPPTSDPAADQGGVNP